MAATRVAVAAVAAVGRAVSLVAARAVPLVAARTVSVVGARAGFASAAAARAVEWMVAG